LIIFVSSYLRQRGRNLPYSNVASAHKTITVDISSFRSLSNRVRMALRLRESRCPWIKFCPDRAKSYAVSSYLRQRGRNLPYSNVASAHKTITVDISHGAGYVELKCLLLITYGERKKVRRISTNNVGASARVGALNFSPRIPPCN
jgi:hypothetical protein